MSPDTEHLDVPALAAEEVRLAEQAERIAARREQIRTLLREHLTVGSHPAGVYTVQVRAGARRVDTRKVADAYPFDDFPQLYAVAVDLERVRKNLAPVELERFTTQGAASVIVK